MSSPDSADFGDFDYPEDSVRGEEGDHAFMEILEPWLDGGGLVMYGTGYGYDNLTEDDDDDEEEDDDEVDVELTDEGQQLPHPNSRQIDAALLGEGVRTTRRSVWAAEAEEDPSPHVTRPRQPPNPNEMTVTPSRAGQKLMASGLFGAFERPKFADAAKNVPGHRRPLAMRLLAREFGQADTYYDRLRNQRLMAQSMIPVTPAEMIIRYKAPAYLGQFSDDGNFFYSATKDFRVRMYDTSNVNEWRLYKTVRHPSGQWTLTDASLSPDNRWLAFTSMMPHICLAPTDPYDQGDPYLLNLSTNMQNHNYGFAIFSARFSGDGRELVAGTSAHSIVVYDIESRRLLHNIHGHEDDVNAVCFGDRTSPHLLYSGSDDATIKVWDRRSLSDGRPAGAFVGHCEGITYIDSKGDGRYILSNSKDQTMRLWDLRKAMSPTDFDRDDPARLTRDSSYDYRFEQYDTRLSFRHPYDNSVAVFRGHRVERTLLRCHFSPPGSSDGAYVYSASHSGRVFVWNLDTSLAGTIDVETAVSTSTSRLSSQEKNEKETGRMRNSMRYPPVRFGSRICVRDASWHPTVPLIASSGFSVSESGVGFCTVHAAGVSQDGDADGRENRLYDEKLKPLTAAEAIKDDRLRSRSMRW